MKLYYDTLVLFNMLNTICIGKYNNWTWIFDDAPLRVLFEYPRPISQKLNHIWYIIYHLIINMLFP